MNPIAFGAAAWLLALSSSPVPAATPAPEFLPLAGSKHPSQAKGGPIMRSVGTQTMAAPLISEVRAVPGPDGSIRIRCRELPNPGRHDADRHAGPGPQR
ncbi:hypothetical protein [Tahibacter caeni]|uniref:hypothetical protein n=1 Tax=Tahibacter caeni TaxID=1453545 RepID=UPI0021484513|nr:hypothetical protein [Tahibacter caeni]